MIPQYPVPFGWKPDPYFGIVRDHIFEAFAQEQMLLQQQAQNIYYGPGSDTAQQIALLLLLS